MNRALEADTTVDSLDVYSVLAIFFGSLLGLMCVGRCVSNYVTCGFMVRESDPTSAQTSAPPSKPAPAPTEPKPDKKPDKKPNKDKKTPAADAASAV